MYGARFAANVEYRKEVWSVLVADWFGQYVHARRRGARSRLWLWRVHQYRPVPREIRDGSQPGRDAIPREGGDVSPAGLLKPMAAAGRFARRRVHEQFLRTSAGQGRARPHAWTRFSRCLRPGGRLVAMGPNIKYLPGEYWDFWDHYVPLTEASLKEALVVAGIRRDRVPRAIPALYHGHWAALPCGLSARVPEVAAGLAHLRQAVPRRGHPTVRSLKNAVISQLRVGRTP